MTSILRIGGTGSVHDDDPSNPLGVLPRAARVCSYWVHTETKMSDGKVFHSHELRDMYDEDDDNVYVRLCGP